MNETLKRAISGAVYVILLLASILYSTESFFILFGIFLIIAIYEFCSLIQVHKVFPILFGIILYTMVTLVSHYNKITTDTINQAFDTDLEIAINIQQLDLVLLVIALVVSIKCILFLFYDNIQKISTSSKYLYLLGYIMLPFIFITKISFGINDYNPKIIIGLFILDKVQKMWFDAFFIRARRKTLCGWHDADLQITCIQPDGRHPERKMRALCDR